MTEKVDPITYQVINSSVSGIVREMQNSLFRTGYSTIIRESQDASCGILDRQGRLVGQFVVLPLHMGAFPAVIEAVLKNYPPETISEGDAFLTNHPYLGGSPHASDMAVATPIFYRGELVGFCCNIAHKSDMGGTVPGSGSGQAREIYHEGLHLPAVRHVRRYEPLKEIEAIISANSRTPEMVVGDIRGQVGCLRIGEKRVQALMDKCSAGTVLAAWNQLFDKTEARVRAEIARWPDGSYEAEGVMDNDGIDLDRPVRLHVRVAKNKDRISFDFSESDGQTRGPVNIRPPLVRACCFYGLIAMIDPTIPSNHGLSRVVETIFRERSVLNPALPAPVNTYAPTATLACEIVIAALGQMVQNKRVACGGGGGAMIMGGNSTRTGRSYVQYEILSGGRGGSSISDGASSIGSYIGDCRVTPLEIIEAEFPMRMRRFELIRDSGGPGRFRGGLAYVREYEVLEEEARFSLRSDKHVVSAWGLEGGLPGRVGAVIVNPGTPGEKRLPSRFGDFILKPGDILRIERAGGGGFGDPRERERVMIREDLLNGYISPEQAREVYGLSEES